MLMEPYISQAIRKERLFEEDFTYDQIKDVLLGLKVVSVRPGRVIENRYLVHVNDAEHVKTFASANGALSFARAISEYVDGDPRYGEPVCCVRRPLLFVHHALQQRA